MKPQTETTLFYLGVAAVVSVGLLTVNPNAFFGILVVLVSLFGYFLPWLTAWMSDHKNSSAIFVLNLLLGWTVVFWVLAMVWAFIAQDKPKASE